jgi:hypothetical protein
VLSDRGECQVDEMGLHVARGPWQGLGGVGCRIPLRNIEVVSSLMRTPVVPKASPETLSEFVTSLEPFASLFRRSTNWVSVERSLTGLLTDLPRKHCDTITAAVAGLRPNACNLS